MNRELWLWLVAGPNGAGKSTYAVNLPVQEIINPDDIAREYLPEAPKKVALTAGREAIRRILDLIRQRRSFGVETTLSGRFHLEATERAKSDGWNVGLVFIGLSSPDLSIERIRQRTLARGHDVPATDVRRRYERSLRNLPVMYQLADLVLIFDNSYARWPMRRVLEARRREIVFQARRLPEWLKRSLGALIGSAPRSRQRKS